jgi:hypothetical protein
LRSGSSRSMEERENCDFFSSRSRFVFLFIMFALCLSRQGLQIWRGLNGCTG